MCLMRWPVGKCMLVSDLIAEAEADNLHATPEDTEPGSLRELDVMHRYGCRGRAPGHQAFQARSQIWHRQPLRKGVLDCETAQLSCPLPIELTVRSSGASADSVHRYCKAQLLQRQQQRASIL